MKEMYHAKAIANYLAGESLTRTYHETITPAVSDNGLRVFGLQTDAKTLVWVDNRFYTWYNIGVQKKSPVPVRNAQLQIPVKRPGTYQVEIWDTRKGEVMKKATVKADGQRVTVALPDVDKDVALKVIHTEQAAR